MHAKSFFLSHQPFTFGSATRLRKKEGLPLTLCMHTTSQSCVEKGILLGIMELTEIFNVADHFPECRCEWLKYGLNDQIFLKPHYLYIAMCQQNEFLKRSGLGT